MPSLFIASRSAVDAAAELIACFGEHAASQASKRAILSREVGNVRMFCHWRQIERLIETLSCDEATDTVH
jgi:hypothetical protein